MGLVLVDAMLNEDELKFSCDDLELACRNFLFFVRLVGGAINQSSNDFQDL